MEYEQPISDSDLLAPAPKTPGKRRIAVVTGSRADYGLLKPVMRAIAAEPGLELAAVVAGSHFLKPANTHLEVQADFRVAGAVPMQRPGKRTRLDDAEAVGLGVSRFARTFYKVNADAVVVLGDRIEAFSAAAAAGVAGIPLAHVHGGDRAEGIADESMRHAISKLAHAHFAASQASADRLVRMGEDPHRVFVVGSPAIDGLAGIPALSSELARELGDPRIVILLHPSGLDEATERAHAKAIVDFARESGQSVLVLAPNFDPGRDAVLEVLRGAGEKYRWPFVDHLPRERFVGLLKYVAAHHGMLIGNSSAGLIECAAIRCRAVNVGPRQRGREMPASVIDVAEPSVASIRAGLETQRNVEGLTHPYGDGHAGPRIAKHLASLDLTDPLFVRKRCSY